MGASEKEEAEQSEGLEHGCQGHSSPHGVRPQTSDWGVISSECLTTGPAEGMVLHPSPNSQAPMYP